MLIKLRGDALETFTSTIYWNFLKVHQLFRNFFPIRIFISSNIQGLVLEKGPIFYEPFQSWKNQPWRHQLMFSHLRCLLNINYYNNNNSLVLYMFTTKCFETTCLFTIVMPWSLLHITNQFFNVVYNFVQPLLVGQYGT